MSSVWETLSKIDVSEHTEQKNGLTYLSWAWAWGCLLNHYPNSTFKKLIHEVDGVHVPYMKDDQGYAYVMVSVTVEEKTLTEVFPVLDYRNKAVKHPDAFAVNTALQRALAKTIAMHGLGHYIYAGEDIPVGAEEKPVEVDVVSKDGKKETAADWSTVAAVFKTFIPECDTVDSLRTFWGTNKSAIDLLKKNDEALYNEVLQNFLTHKETLEPKGEAA